MTFPETPRIIYNNNPLTEVICQLRFPPILSIDTEIPAKFQNDIRETYPLFQEKIDTPVNIPNEIISQMPPEMINFFPTPGNKNYEFSSEDEKWKINLTRTFLSLTSHNYTRWEVFMEHFNPAYSALCRWYKPSFCTRIGLRYKDLINKSKLNLTDTPWKDLLQPPIAGVLSDGTVLQNVIGSTNVTEIKLDDDMSFVRIRHGLVSIKDESDLCYLIDSDFYTNNRTTIDSAVDKLNYFNNQGRRLLRWCITDKLHDALGPQPL